MKKDEVKLEVKAKLKLYIRRGGSVDKKTLT